MSSSLVCIGIISSPHGLDGQFKAQMRTQESLLESLNHIYIGQDERFAFLATVKSYKPHQNEVLFQISNFKHIDDVSVFIDYPIWCDPKDVPKSVDTQLLDKLVVDEDGKHLGQISSVSFADVRKFIHIVKDQKTLRVPLQDAYFDPEQYLKDTITFKDYHLFADLWE